MITNNFVSALGIVTEKRDSLADLEVTTLSILSAASGHKYTPTEIFEQISFVMTDSTAHNLKVIESVAEKLSAETVPKTLLCNAHPLMLFQNKENEVSINVIVNPKFQSYEYHKMLI